MNSPCTEGYHVSNGAADGAQMGMNAEGSTRVQVGAEESLRVEEDHMQRDLQKLRSARTQRRFLEALVQEASQQLFTVDDVIQDQENTLQQKYRRTWQDEDEADVTGANVLPVSDLIRDAMDSVLRRCPKVTGNDLELASEPTEPRNVDDVADAATGFAHHQPPPTAEKGNVATGGAEQPLIAAAPEASPGRPTGDGSPAGGSAASAAPPEPADALSAQLNASLEQNVLLVRRCRRQAALLRRQNELMGRLHGQLSRSGAENDRQQRHLRLINALFEQLQRQEADGAAAAETGRRTDAAAEEATEEADEAADCSDLVERVDTPHGRRLVIHVSKTYLRLRDLILEKRALLSEIDKLKAFNVQLERRLSKQEHRLSSVAAELHSTWGLVTKLKIQHAQLHTAESVLRYELTEKRRLLSRLRGELEGSRQRSALASQLNDKSELAWRALRTELDQRKRELVRQPHVDEDEPAEPPPDERASPDLGEASPPTEPEDPPTPSSEQLSELADPPDAAGPPPAGPAARPPGRLQSLEEQCQELYTRLVSTAARQVALSSRLAELHQLHGASESASVASSSTDTAYASSDQQQTPSEAEADDLPTDAGAEPADRPPSPGGRPPSALGELGSSDTLDGAPSVARATVAAGRAGLAVAALNVAVEADGGPVSLPSPPAGQLATPSAHLAGADRALVASVVAVAEPPAPPAAVQAGGAGRAGSSEPDELGGLISPEESGEPDELEDLDEPDELDELNDRDALEELNEPDELHEFNDPGELGAPDESALAAAQEVRDRSQTDAAGREDDGSDVSRTTADLLEEVARFLGRTRRVSPAVQTAPEPAPAERPSDSDEPDEPDEPRPFGVSAGCKLISMLPSRMVHLRRERQQLTERIAELEQQNERIEQKLAGMRTERREHRRRGREQTTARRHLEQRVQELERRLQREQQLRIQLEQCAAPARRHLAPTSEARQDFRPISEAQPAFSTESDFQPDFQPESEAQRDCLSATAETGAAVPSPDESSPGDGAPDAADTALSCSAGGAGRPDGGATVAAEGNSDVSGLGRGEANGSGGLAAAGEAEHPGESPVRPDWGGDPGRDGAGIVDAGEPRPPAGTDTGAVGPGELRASDEAGGRSSGSEADGTARRETERHRAELEQVCQQLADARAQLRRLQADCRTATQELQQLRVRVNQEQPSPNVPADAPEATVPSSGQTLDNALRLSCACNEQRMDCAEFKRLVVDQLQRQRLPVSAPARDATRCQLCQSPFRLFVRRYTCRRCGGKFCKKCTSIVIHRAGRQVKMCLDCFYDVALGALHRHQKTAVEDAASAECSGRPAAAVGGGDEPTEGAGCT